MIAALAIATGLAPATLLELEPEMLATLADVAAHPGEG